MHSRSVIGQSLHLMASYNIWANSILIESLKTISTSQYHRFVVVFYFLKTQRGKHCFCYNCVWILYVFVAFHFFNNIILWYISFILDDVVQILLDYTRFFVIFISDQKLVFASLHSIVLHLLFGTLVCKIEYNWKKKLNKKTYHVTYQNMLIFKLISENYSWFLSVIKSWYLNHYIPLFHIYFLGMHFGLLDWMQLTNLKPHILI